MYAKSAQYYDLIYGKDADRNRAEAEKLHSLIQERVPGARSLLDVGCGTGGHLEALSRYYDVCGIDLDPQMVAISRERLPGAPIHEADMRSFDLGRRFDVVMNVFASIAYAQGVEELESTIGSMTRHLRPGGILILEPYLTPDMWRPGNIVLKVVDQPELKIARLSVWRKPQGSSLQVVFNYMVATPAGVDIFDEHHMTNLFSLDQYKAALTTNGLKVEYEPGGLSWARPDAPNWAKGRGVYLGLDPAPFEPLK